MSGVRLSNGSPTFERTEPRVTEHPKPSACRSLFGPVDHEQLGRDFHAHMRELEEAAAAEWGFDFVHDAPLASSGRFTWEVVESDELPEFYKRPPRRELGGTLRCVRPVPSEDPARCDGQAESGLRKRAAGHEPCTHGKRSHPSPEEVSRAGERTPGRPSPRRQT